MRTAIFAAVVMITACLHAAAPSDQKLADRTWTDPAKAAAEDPDFSIQGEYGVAQQGQAWGVQVVALGGGKFDAYLLEGGLPGLGWTRAKQRIQLNGALEDDVVKLATEDKATRAEIRDGAIQVSRNGEAITTLPRIHRKSPSLGAKPPQGAVVLFDGSSADAWTNGRVENGLLPNSNITSKQAFTDYRLHLEFRTPYKPYARGQQRGNSGVYQQARFETQVLDSFGLEGKMNETGGVYSIAEPLLNMCFPPLTWQTYDINFQAARFDDAGKLMKNAQMTVRLNGVIVHRNLELPHTTTASPLKTITPEPGPVYIQHHNNPVYYRNIWIVPR